MPYHVNSRSKLKKLEGGNAPPPDERHKHGVTLLALIDSLARMQPPAGSPLPMWIGWLYERREVHRLLGEAFRIADHAHRMQAKHLDRQIARLTHQLAKENPVDRTPPPMPGDLCAMCSSLGGQPRKPPDRGTCHACHACHGGRGGAEVCANQQCEGGE